MNPEKLAGLAARCEQATGPSYELDCAIWDAIYPGERDERFDKLNSEGPLRGRLGPADRDGYIKPLRSFTASLDAAMSLVPEGWAVQIIRTADGRHGGANLYLFANEDDREPSSRRSGDAATPALALVAASLRSLASRGGN